MASSSEVSLNKPKSAKEKYAEKIAEAYASVENVCTNPIGFNRDLIKDIIELVLECKATKDQCGKKRMFNLERGILARYDVFMKDGEKQLFIIQIDGYTTWKRVLACEDSFDVIEDMHKRTNCGGKDKIREMIKIESDYFVSMLAVDTYLSVCDCCKRTVTFNTLCGVHTIPLPSRDDSEFKYVLVVEDIQTHFIHLRPLSTLDSHEIAMELFKIFMDFGVPLKIQFCDEILNDEQTSDFIKKLCSTDSVQFEQLIDPPTTATYILNMLEEWMTSAKSKHWVVICHMVQYKINNMFKLDIKTTPFKAVFGEETPPILNIEANLR